MEPKLHNLWKTVRKHGFLKIFFAIMTVFQSFFNFGTILVQKLNSFICKKNPIFWNPWERVNSGMNCFSFYTATHCAWVNIFSGGFYSFEAFVWSTAARQAVHSPKTQNVKLTTAILEPYAWPCRKGTLDLTTLNKIECLGSYKKVLFIGFKIIGTYIILV